MNVQRLVQKIDGAAFIALERIIHFAPSRADEHDWNVLGLFSAAHQLGQLKAIHAWHLHVEDGNREFMLQQQRQRLVSRQGFIYGTVLALDKRFERQQVLRQIVNDQEFGLNIT